MFKITKKQLQGVSLKTKRFKLKAIRDLLDIQSIENNTIQTSYGYKYYIKIVPRNVNIIQNDALLSIIEKFKRICNLAGNFEILVLDKTERLEDNQNYISKLYDSTNSLVFKRLLANDLQYLKNLQSLSGASRDFFIMLNYRDKNGLERIYRIEQALRDENFEISDCSQADLQNMLQVYFERNFTNKIVSDPLGMIDFMDLITPSVLKFYSDYYVFGNTYRKVFAIKNYTLETDNMAILRKFGQRSNITLKIYASKMANKEFENTLESSVHKNTSDANENQFIKSAKASQKLDISNKLIKFLGNSQDESMFAVTVYIEVIANSYNELLSICDSTISKLDGISYDSLYMQQKDGFLAVHPIGRDVFKSEFERHMPSSSLSNLFPFSYSGCIDKEGQPLGYDRHGGHIIIDFNKRTPTHTNSSIVILGNSGEGKTFALKNILTNLKLKGSHIIALDAEHEEEELTNNLEGNFIDLLSGKYIINLLEPKRFFEKSDENDVDDGEDIKTFTISTVLGQHISFLRDFFKMYRNIDNDLLNVLEIMLDRTYKKFGIDADTDISTLSPGKFPVLSDLYEVIDNEHKNFGSLDRPLYTEDMLRNLLLSLNSICVGSDSLYFNGHTNIKSYEFVTFGVKSLLETSTSLKNAMLFNIFAYMANKLLVDGNTFLFIDELYLFLEEPILIKYIRNFMKRVRKKESGVVLASHNIEDFLQPGIDKIAKPLFEIPTYRLLFYPGENNKEEFKKLVNITESEFNLIKSPNQGNCLFIAGTNRYNLRVFAPDYKKELFGTRSGR